MAVGRERKQQEKKAEQERERAQREFEAEQQRLARVDDELQKLINAEIDAIEAVTDDEKAMAYVGQIQADIVQNWSRPPSARNGMEALLQIQLIPTGEIVSVTILKSSGNSAFDSSAVNAVNKAAAFPELRQLPNSEFERTFRRFRLLFRPEDLRY